MPDPAVAELGAALYAARRSGVPIDPLTDAHADLSVTDVDSRIIGWRIKLADTTART